MYFIESLNHCQLCVPLFKKNNSSTKVPKKNSCKLRKISEGPEFIMKLSKFYKYSIITKSMKATFKATNRVSNPVNI